jgi:hypothetical protein
MKKTFALIWLAASTGAFAISGTVHRVAIEGATSAELDSTVIPNGVLAYRISDYRDVRLGNGVDPGGIGLWNYSALTNPPELYDRNLGMQGHSLIWNDMTFNSLSSGAEGPLWCLRNKGSNVLTIVSGRDSLHNGIVMIDDGGDSADVIIQLLNETGTTAPLIEYCDNITNQVWHTATGAITRLSQNLVEYREVAPQSTSSNWMLSRTYRVTQPEVPVRMKSYVPIDAPAFTTNGAPLSLEETDPSFSASASVGITADLIDDWSTAFSWGNHAAAGYLTSETDIASAAITPYTNFGTTNIIIEATNGSWQGLWPTASCRVAVMAKSPAEGVSYRFSIVGGSTSTVTLVTNLGGYATVINGIAWTNYNTNAGATNVFLLDSDYGQTGFNLLYLKPS